MTLLGPPAIHPMARVEEGAVIGEGTRIWANAHIREGARIGAECVIGEGAFIDLGVSIGDRCKIQNNALIYHGATLGDGVFIGPAACLTNDTKPRATTPDGALKSPEDWTVSEIVVEDYVSIGAHAVIVAPCRLGLGAMVGAGSVVTRDVATRSLVYGNPATHQADLCLCGNRLRGTSCPECGRRY